ncbi:MAG: hypothetical protein R3F11_18360 [Verrucomicrobiales bacterium]
MRCPDRGVADFGARVGEGDDATVSAPALRRPAGAVHALRRGPVAASLAAPGTGYDPASLRDGRRSAP